VLEDLRLEVVNLHRRTSRAVSESLRAARHGMERARNRLGDPRRLLDERRQRLDDAVERARRVLSRRLTTAHAELRTAETRLYRAHPQRRILEQRSALAAMRHRLEAAIRPALVRRRHHIEAAAGKLEALSPTRVLERGFSLTQRADGHIVTRAADLTPGERVHVRVREGSFEATVDSGPPKPTKPAKGRPT
jgi:exodeoxyribonuclease VII large subunit